MIETIVKESPAAERLLKYLKSDKWMTRSDLAKAIGKPRLIPNEIRALTSLAKRDVIDARLEQMGDSSTFYYRKKDNHEKTHSGGLR